jgi:Spy/CpxP family protein refolding chaperone
MSETSTSVGCRPAARILITVLALSALFMTGRVFGQGTSGTLPGPISSHDLATWADQLELGDEQRQAIDPFHEEYREAFRQLRDGEIEEYLQEVGGMMGRGFRGLDKDAIEDSLRKLDRLMTRISLLDEGLFNNMQTALSDEQVAKLPRVMQARKRERFRTGATRMAGSANRAARVDMSDLYYGLELTPDQRQATDPLVVQYEDRLTAATEDLYEAATRMFLVVVEALEDAGVSFENIARGGPPPADMMNAMRNAWTEANKKPREKAAAISDLNNQTLRRLSEFLPPDAASTLRDRYLGRAYPEVPRASQSQALKSFHAALRLPSLSPDLRADINALAVEFRGSANQVVDEMIKAVDEYRNNAAPFGRDRTLRREYNQKLEGYRERLAALDQTAVETLGGLLGPDLSQSVKIAAADTTFEDETSEADGRDRRRAGSSVGEATDAFIAGLGPDPFLPSPITSRDVAIYTKRLELDDNDRFILKSLHQEYVGAFGQLKRTDIATLRAALAAARPPREERRQEGPRRGEENARPTGPTPQQVDEIYELRGSALKSIQTLDGTFFDDIETLIAAPEQAALVQRLRTARERSVYNRGLEANPFDAMFGGRGRRHGRGGPRGPNMGSQSNESGVDLSYLVEKLDLDAGGRAEMDKLLADYEANALDGFRRQYESVLKLRREIERLRAQRAQPDGDGNRRERDRQAMQSRWESFQRLQENEGRKATDDRKFMVDLNRATLAVLTEALPEEAAAQLDQAYNHAAFPSIYDDPDGADRYLTTALQLRDLGESQRDGIDAIIAEYRPAYEKLAEQIAEIHAARADEGNDFDRERWRTYQEQRNRIEVLDFERQELNAKALRQLREVLTDEQVERLRLPSEVARNTGDGGRSG